MSTTQDYQAAEQLLRRPAREPQLEQAQGREALPEEIR